MPDGKCIIVCRECSDAANGPMFIPFTSYQKRGKWAAAHKTGTGHDKWFCVDGWPSPARVSELLTEYDAATNPPLDTDNTTT